MKSKLREYLKTVQELQSICNNSTSRFVIDVFNHNEFKVFVDYIEDDELKRAYFDFHDCRSEDWYEDNIKNIKTIVEA